MFRLPALLSATLLLAARLPAQEPVAQEPAGKLPAAQEPAGTEMKEADLRKIGRHVGKWFTGRVENSFDKTEGAKADLIAECDDMDKKLKTRSVLSLVKDWEAIFDLGREFDTSGADFKKGKAFELDLPNEVGKCGVRLPSTYNPKKENYPGLLILTTGKTVEALEALPEEVKEAYVILGVDLTGLDAETVLGDAGLPRVLLPIRTASMLYRVDRRRLYLLGQGDLGTSAASRLAAVYPMAFAGCVLVGGTSAATTNAGNLKLLPFETKEDTPAALAWIATLPPRESYPLNFEVTLTESWQGRYYWVQALRFDPPSAVPAGKVARFKVAVNRETNTITIDSEFVYRFQIYLNDAIVDLDQPVKILRNGELHTFQATRSVATALENFEGTLDAGLFFPAVVRRVDVPAPAGN